MHDPGHGKGDCYDEWFTWHGVRARHRADNCDSGTPERRGASWLIQDRGKLWMQPSAGNLVGRRRPWLASRRISCDKRLVGHGHGCRLGECSWPACGIKHCRAVARHGGAAASAPVWFMIFHDEERWRLGQAIFERADPHTTLNDGIAPGQADRPGGRMSWCWWLGIVGRSGCLQRSCEVAKTTSRRHCPRLDAADHSHSTLAIRSSANTGHRRV